MKVGGRCNFWTSDIFDSDVELVWAGEAPDLPAARGLSAIGPSIANLPGLLGRVSMGGRQVHPCAGGSGLGSLHSLELGERAAALDVEAHWAHLVDVSCGEGNAGRGLHSHQSDALEAAGLQE